MTKKPNKQTKKEENKFTREAELERENELLRLEISYLKKLRAFRERRSGYRTQRTHYSPI